MTSASSARRASRNVCHTPSNLRRRTSLKTLPFTRSRWARTPTPVSPRPSSERTRSCRLRKVHGSALRRHTRWRTRGRPAHRARTVTGGRTYAPRATKAARADMTCRWPRGGGYLRALAWPAVGTLCPRRTSERTRGMRQGRPRARGASPSLLPNHCVISFEMALSERREALGSIADRRGNGCAPDFQKRPRSTQRTRCRRWARWRNGDVDRRAAILLLEPDEDELTGPERVSAETSDAKAAVGAIHRRRPRGESAVVTGRQAEMRNALAHINTATATTRAGRTIVVLLSRPSCRQKPDRTGTPG